MCFKCTDANNVSYVDYICLEMLIVNNGQNDFGMQINRNIYTSHSFRKFIKTLDCHNQNNEYIARKPSISLVFAQHYGWFQHHHPPTYTLIHPTKHLSTTHNTRSSLQKQELKA